MKDKSQAPQWMLDADEEIQNADGFVVVLPEYNCRWICEISDFLFIFVWRDLYSF